ncbi:hypothetical protein MKW92_042797 [Papaver armeniacum]|nr:hypothetical protein MKW92_042797 [Papaver armeniacum]
MATSFLSASHLLLSPNGEARKCRFMDTTRSLFLSNKNGVISKSHGRFVVKSMVSRTSNSQFPHIHYLHFLVLGAISISIFTFFCQFGMGRKKATVVKRETVIPGPDYRLPVGFLGLAGGLAYTDNLFGAVPVGLIGLLLLVQSTRVKFVFDDEALEVKIGEQLEESGENAFVGGKNRWKYSSFINWELWWPNFPILVYFKETQTKPEGQIHFFPVIFNGKQLYDVMVERAGPSKTSGPK